MFLLRHIENIERIFNSDVREKRRAATGVHHRASRRGYIRGGVKTQSDFLTAKQKRELNGEIRVSNKYDNLENVPQLRDLDQRPREEAKMILTYVRNVHKQKDIAKHFGISTGTLPYWYEKFGLDMTPRTNGGRKPQGEKVFDSIEDIPIYAELMKLPKSKQAGILVAGRGQFGMSALRRRIGVGQSKIYSLFKELNIKVGEAANTSAAKEAAAALVEEKASPEIKSEISDHREAASAKVPVDYAEVVKELQLLRELYKKEIDRPKGFEININDDMTKDQLQERLLGIVGTFAADREYRVRLNIEEIKK